MDEHARIGDYNVGVLLRPVLLAAPISLPVRPFHVSPLLEPFPLL